ncbi:MAG: hypothetical protein IJZ29_00145 [Clostridia bacterium]|nr:hypothetical protein [Clostridia bacterium]
MAKLEIYFNGYNDSLQNMTINGNKVTFKTNSKGIKYCESEIETNTAEIIIYKPHHYIGKYWFFWTLFCFFISIFGLFDARQNKKFHIIEFKTQIKMETSTQLTFTILKQEENEKFISISDNANVTEIINKQYYDKTAQKRHKIMKRTKIGITIFCILLAILLISL